MSLKLFKKTASIFTLVIFISSNSIYAGPESKSIFKHKKVDYQKINDQNQSVIQKKKAILNGEDTDQVESQKRETQKILSSHLSDISLIHIPSELGRIVEVYQAQGSELKAQRQDRLIVHIQDLHTNPEAEYNLAKMLELLLNDYKMGLVCSEGAAGVLDTKEIASFPDYTAREKVGRMFVNTGELTGEEYLAITKYPDLPIWGIETEDIYFKNIIDFNKIMKFNPGSQVFISQAKKALEELKARIYTKELLDLDQKEADYKAQKIETNEYIAYLSSRGEVCLSPTLKYKNIDLLKETMESEKKIDHLKIMSESQNLLLNLQASFMAKSLKADSDSLMANAQLFNDQKISSFSFYSYLKDLGQRHLKKDDFAVKYHNLDSFTDYLAKVNSIDSTDLFIELENLSFQIKEALSKTDEQKTLVKALRNIDFLEGFFNLKVSNEELDYYIHNRDSHKVAFFESFLKPALKKYNINAFIDYNPSLIDPHLTELEEFYKVVKERDIAMVNNSLSEIEKRNSRVNALIAGGFHTKGITKLLREKGYSYIVVSPYSKTDIDEANYHFLLSGQRKPITELLNQLDLKEIINRLAVTLRVPLASNTILVDDFNKRVAPEIARLSGLPLDKVTIESIMSRISVTFGLIKKGVSEWAECPIDMEFKVPENGVLVVRYGSASIDKDEYVKIIGDEVSETDKTDFKGKTVIRITGNIKYPDKDAAEPVVKKGEEQLQLILDRLKNENVISQLDKGVYGKTFEEVMALNPQWARSGFETDKKGRKINRLGWTLENLRWMLENPSKVQQVLSGAEEIRARYRYVIFCGMGGSGLSVQTLKTTFGEPKGLNIYSLRTTDPAVIKDILDEIALDAGSLEAALAQTLIILISKSGTTQETVSHKEYFEKLFANFMIDITDHMWVVTDKGSPMDTGRYEQKEIQLNGREDIGGRFTSPTTNIFLLPLALVAPEKVNAVLEKARAMNEIGDVDNDIFIKLGAYLYYMASELGKDKATFMVPKELQDLPMWSEQLVEESLGKSGKGVTIFYGEDISDASLKDVGKNDRVFLRINIGGRKTNDELWKHLEKNGYPVFEINVDDVDSIGGIMLGLQRAVAVIGYLWDICFVDQPAVEGYKIATREVMSKLQPGEKVEALHDWKSASFGRLKLYYDRLMQVGAITEKELETEVQRLGATMDDAAAVYAGIINILKAKPGFEAKELTSYGRMTEGMRGILQRARTDIFTNGLQMPSKFGEGPDKNHSYQQNIEDGKNMWLSTYFMPLEIEQPEVLPYDDNLIRAQTLGTVNSIVNGGRKVMLITFDSTTLEAEKDAQLFFKKVASHLQSVIGFKLPTRPRMNDL